VSTARPAPLVRRSPIVPEERGANGVKVDLVTSRAAVLVLDVQSLFAAPDGPFGNTTALPMIAAINVLLAHARTFGVPVVHSRYVLRDDLRDAGLLASSGFDLAPFARGAAVAGIDARVDLAAGDLHAEHHRPSAFFASDLDALLRSLHVDQLVLSGLSVNNAVAATARDAFARDIPCVVVREATGGAPFESADDIAAAFRSLDTWTAEVVSLDDVLARLR
jgi:nicotinamidase-related amidase